MRYLYSAFEKVQSPLNQHLEEVSLKCSHCNLIGQSMHRITSVHIIANVYIIFVNSPTVFAQLCEALILTVMSLLLSLDFISVLQCNMCFI